MFQTIASLFTVFQKKGSSQVFDRPIVVGLWLSTTEFYTLPTVFWWKLWIARTTQSVELNSQCCLVCHQVEVDTIGKNREARKRITSHAGSLQSIVWPLTAAPAYRHRSRRRWRVVRYVAGINIRLELFIISPKSRPRLLNSGRFPSLPFVYRRTRDFLARAKFFFFFFFFLLLASVGRWNEKTL